MSCHTLLLVCAGQSTRFPGYRPKWSLTHPSGNLMACEAVRGITGYDRLVVALRKQDISNYSASAILREFEAAGLCVNRLVSVAHSECPADTVCAAIAAHALPANRPFTVKDCDNRFDLALHSDKNEHVAVVDLHTVGLVDPAGKSYVYPEGGPLADWKPPVAEYLVEGKIVSHLFCCGAYTFHSPLAFTVKDCDNRFDLALRSDKNEHVAVVDLHTVGLVDPAGKSYVYPEGGPLADWKPPVAEYLVEGRVVSHLFCCGAYTFHSPLAFTVYADLAGPGATMAKVLSAARCEHRTVAIDAATGYEDWGTAEAWERARAEHMTLFVDIDGVLTASAHRSFAPQWGDAPAIQPNVDALNALRATGKVEVILTTSRTGDRTTRAATRRQLARVGVQYDRLIMGLRACTRYVVNDARAPGDRTAVGITIDRDAPVLGRMLRAARGG